MQTTSEPIVLKVDPELISLLKEIRDLLQPKELPNDDLGLDVIKKVVEMQKAQKLTEVRGYGQIPAFEPPDYFTD